MVEVETVITYDRQEQGHAKQTVARKQIGSQGLTYKWLTLHQEMLKGARDSLV